MNYTLNAREIPLFQSKELNEILKSELDAGNQIIEESAWPPKCSKLILLKTHFHRVYVVDTLTYNKPADPHHWYEEYLSKDGCECIACR